MKKLKPTQEKAAAMLADGLKACEVAKEVGVTPETISIWRRDSCFQAHVNQLKWNHLESTRDKLRASAGEVAITILELMRSSRSDRVRLQAATYVLRVLGFEDPNLLHVGIGSMSTDSIDEDALLRRMMALGDG